jgi:adenosylcobinamide-phosphate synthase
MNFEHNAVVLFAALLLEAGLGYPNRLFAAIGHPVTWMGALITSLDRTLNQQAWSDTMRRFAGIGALATLLLVAGAVGFALKAAGGALGLVGLSITAVLASTLLAQRSLHEHVARVAAGLRANGIEGGRQAVSQIVGRNPATLDEAAICRAAIESLAENFSDGIVGPAFWLGLGGLPGSVAYKAVNTADSMIGHKTPRHAAFGWAAARFDDLVNLPASRLSALLIVAAAALHSKTSAREAWRAAWRDAGRHRSPNAGWPEAAMAGALGLRLAGPRIYGTTLVDDHWMGDGRTAAAAEDIDTALALYRRACALLIGLAGLISLALLLH